ILFNKWNETGIQSSTKQKIFNAAKEYGEKVKGKDAQASGEGLVTGLEDMSSKCRATKLEFEHEKFKVLTIRPQRT
ncbi:hypothetical protein Tco_1578814, partial [Tanacetum coccineum]